MTEDETLRYLIRTDSGDRGPFNRLQILAFSAQGQLASSNRIWDQQTGQSITVGQIISQATGLGQVIDMPGPTIDPSPPMDPPSPTPEPASALAPAVPVAPTTRPVRRGSIDPLSVPSGDAAGPGTSLEAIIVEDVPFPTKATQQPTRSTVVTKPPGAPLTAKPKTGEPPQAPPEAGVTRRPSARAGTRRKTAVVRRPSTLANPAAGESPKASKQFQKPLLVAGILLAAGVVATALVLSFGRGSCTPEGQVRAALTAAQANDLAGLVNALCDQTQQDDFKTRWESARSTLVPDDSRAQIDDLLRTLTSQDPEVRILQMATPILELLASDAKPLQLALQNQVTARFGSEYEPANWGYNLLIKAAADPTLSNRERLRKAVTAMAEAVKAMDLAKSDDFKTMSYADLLRKGGPGLSGLKGMAQALFDLDINQMLSQAKVSSQTTGGTATVTVSFIVNNTSFDLRIPLIQRGNRWTLASPSGGKAPVKVEPTPEPAPSDAPAAPKGPKGVLNNFLFHLQHRLQPAAPADSKTKEPADQPKGPGRKESSSAGKAPVKGPATKALE